jgi:hypothetical protein
MKRRFSVSKQERYIILKEKARMCDMIAKKKEELIAHTENADINGMNQMIVDAIKAKLEILQDT